MPHPRRVLLIAATSAAVTAASGLVTLNAFAAAGCRIHYTVTNQWQGGFGADVTIDNLGDPIPNWTLNFTFGPGQSITQAWNASFIQSGAAVTVRDAGYNAAIPTNGSASFGFNGAFSSANPVPTGFTLNGTACTGGVTNPSTTPSSPQPSGPQPSNPPPQPGTGRQMERLDRGLVSVRSGNGNLVSWRWLAADPSDVAFNIYRDGTKANATPITGSTNYLDSGAGSGAAYTVRAVVGGTEQAPSPAALRFAAGYLDVPIQNPDPARYAANDASVGDLDGDGQPDLVLKWDPLNAKDNSQSGVTDPVYLDGYKLNGTRLWRINLGRNIRAGAHYTQFQVYDYDGDGTAEVAMKTADGTVSGTGQVIGNASADHRNSDGYVLAGPEFLTVFSGRTGAVLATTNYEPPRGTVSSWGDNYGNRADRFLAATAYLDGSRPSIIMARGYYTRSVIVAWDFRNGTLTRRWTFDSSASGNGSYAAQGNHNLSVADVDADGRDEIVYGSMAVDDNGARLWNTGNGHGDAMHVGDLDPARPGLEVFKVDEDGSKPSSWFADARTGQVLWSTPASGDNGRGVSADVWAGSPGAESWSAAPVGLRSPNGTVVNNRKPGSMNFLAWWDADPVRELLDGNHIDKYGTSGDARLLTAAGVHSNNGTKSTPSLSGDILGDWREEVIWPTADNTALRIYSTPVPTDRRITTLLQDAQYRVALAWQNTAYNQPPHPSFFIGVDMRTPPRPTIRQP
ncbi:rhamnogalacturonan lyase family protein [Actinoplanes aureus]|uniref:Cellulose binding domain-containing protein n=1 Tax=Actinoplanes aureus TaxID=2792083 RepID=A0A931G3H5_9ACTN|nr:cellulose binding domain-containing protein [Actinoplanes aureus]MBG0569265.1 cellulose binding domain-containing protein [Actinoplanes aureus]